MLKMALDEEDGMNCPGEDCPEPLKVPIALTYVLYTEGELTTYSGEGDR